MTEISPLISVCIANYNGVAVIDDCIRSVLAQEGNISVEILIHDDASTDGSVARIRDRFPNAKLIVSEDNVGFCVANNRMAAEAKGKYLLLLNNDAALYPDALQTLLSEANRLNRPAILSLPQYDATNGSLIDIGCLLDPFCNPVPNLRTNRNDVAMVIGACLWIPKTLWDELEGFPEWFGSIGEDLYLCCRARLAGHPVRALGVSGYRHRVGTSFGGGKAHGGKLSTTFRRRALSESNKTFVIAMTYPSPFMQLLLPIHVILLLVEGVLLSVAKCDLSCLREIYLPVLGKLYRQRKQLSTGRRAIMQSSRLASANYFAPFCLLPRKLRMLFHHGLPDLH